MTTHPLPPPRTRALENHYTNTAQKLLQFAHILRANINTIHNAVATSSCPPTYKPLLLWRGAEETTKHIDAVIGRIKETKARVMVAGDINAGKSTLINSILHQDLLPVDQQPSTTAFIEVESSETQEYLEEIDTNGHVIRHNIEEVATLGKESHSRLHAHVHDNTGLLSNGIMDLVVIDSPGLNTDSAKTTAIFAKQKHIDAIIFVVNSENHFTQSATEFLLEAATEKPQVFLAVNKFDLIRDKEKCRKQILSQLKLISPETHKNPKLQHFVSSHDPQDIQQLQLALRCFLLSKKTSKLIPVKLFLQNLLGEIDELLSSHINHHTDIIRTASDHLMRLSSELGTKLLELPRLQLQVDTEYKAAVKEIEAPFEYLKTVVEYSGVTSYRSFWRKCLDSHHQDSCNSVIKYTALAREHLSTTYKNWDLPVSDLQRVQPIYKDLPCPSLWGILQPGLGKIALACGATFATGLVRRELKWLAGSFCVTGTIYTIYRVTTLQSTLRRRLEAQLDDSASDSLIKGIRTHSIEELDRGMLRKVDACRMEIKGTNLALEKLHDIRQGSAAILDDVAKLQI